MTPAEILDRAAIVIDYQGWTQGLFQDFDGKVCAIGAMRMGAGLYADPRREHLHVEPHELIEAKCAMCHAVKRFHVHHWNDEPGRTKGEVTSMLRAVAATLRARTTPVTQAPVTTDEPQLEEV